MVRCRDGTRRNKKTGLCQPYTNSGPRCPDGTRRNMGVCQPYTNHPTRCRKGTRRNKRTRLCEPLQRMQVSPVQTVQESNSFIGLMQKNVMIPTLDSVKNKTWLQKDDCNIFLIGEKHSAKTNPSCVGIYEMLTDILDEIQTGTFPPIDLMLELTQKDNALYFKNRKSYNLFSLQINNVRKLLSQCSTLRDCGINVHWTDINTMHKNVKKSDKPCDTTGVKGADRLPTWILDLAKISLFQDWSKLTHVKAKLQTEEDIPKLLTEHCVVKKEIDKASLLYPQFTMKFAERLFKQIVKDEFKVFTYEGRVQLALRSVIDFYTVARILKSNMKNVIVYAGNLHTNNVITILLELGFHVMEQKPGTCYT